MKAAGETERRQEVPVPRPGSAPEAAAATAATRGTGKVGREKGSEGAGPWNKTGVDWLGLVYASRPLAGACPEGLAWQHPNCGLSLAPRRSLTLRALGPRAQAEGGERPAQWILGQQR